MAHSNERLREEEAEEQPIRTAESGLSCDRPKRENTFTSVEHSPMLPLAEEGTNLPPSTSILFDHERLNDSTPWTKTYEPEGITVPVAYERVPQSVYQSIKARKMVAYYNAPMELGCDETSFKVDSNGEERQADMVGFITSGIEMSGNCTVKITPEYGYSYIFLDEKGYFWELDYTHTMWYRGTEEELADKIGENLNWPRT